MAANLRKTNKCYRCGAEIEPGSRYCMECGAPLKKPHGNGMIAGVAATLVIVAVFGGNAFKKNAKEADKGSKNATCSAQELMNKAEELCCKAKCLYKEAKDLEQEAAENCQNAKCAYEKAEN